MRETFTMSRRPLKVKLYNQNTDRYQLKEFCKIEEDLYQKFKEKANFQENDFKLYLSYWARVDFNIDIDVSTPVAVKLLYALILDYYKAIQPVIYNTHLIDDQGWIQIWVSGHIEKETT